jgi:Bacterial Ig-like domain (group 3)/FG-GAP-like repeat/MBG domain (YGX type)
LTRGQVNFCDASAPYCTDVHRLGTAQLTSTGVAVLRLTPGIGAHHYQAVFAGTGTSGSSASAVSSLTVTGTFPTTTTISASGSPGNYSLTATVAGMSASAAAPTGNVTFADLTTPGTSLGTAALGSASSPFFALNSIPGPALTGVEIISGDVNNDGKADLISLDSNGSVTVGLGNGDGTFRILPAQHLMTLYFYIGAVVGDFNADGNVDLAAIGGDSNVAILLGNGNGTFSAAAKPPTGSVPAGIVSGDWNGDGLVDLAVTNEASNSVTVLLGNGDGTFTPTPVALATSSSPFEIATGDFNGDGNQDLVVFTGGNETATVYAGNGDGTFTAIAGSGVAGTNGGPIAVADFNGDGIADLVLGFNSAGYVSVYLGAGNGTFAASPSASVLVGHSPDTMIVEDFNGDGIPDVACLSGIGAGVITGPSVMLGKGDGTFQLAGPFTGINSLYVTSGDFNSDGVADLAFKNGFGGDVATNLLLSSFGQSASASLSNISPPGVGVQQVNATYAGDSNFGASTSPEISIIAAVLAPTLTLSAVPSTSSFGQQIVLSATLAPFTNQGLSTDGQSITFFSNGSALGTGLLKSGVATFNLTSLSAGTSTLTASYAGDTSLTSASSNAVSYVVSKANPVITWPTPSSITYGSALTASILNATASVPGAFTYTPSAGTVLSAGSHLLSVSFSPTDSTDYATLTSTASINVAQAALTVTADNASRSFGASNPTLTAVASGVVNNDIVVASATSSATSSSAPGNYPIVPAVTGTNIASYKVTPVNGTLTVTQAKTTTSLTAPAASVLTGASVTFSISVSPGFAGTPTGSVQVLNGTTLLATVPLTAPVTTYTTSSLPVGSNSITAVYQGDTNFSASTSAVFTETVTGPPDFSVTASPSALTIKQGQSASATITLTPLNGYSQTTTFSCSGLPALATCTFSPASLTPTNGPVTSQLTITTEAPTVAKLTGPPGRSEPWRRGTSSIVVLAGLLCLLPMGGRHRRTRSFGLFVILIGLLSSPSLGCAGGSPNSSGGSSGTPVGAAQIIIGAGTSSTSAHSINLTVTVTQ